MYYHKEIRVKGEIVGKSYPINLSVETSDFNGVVDCKIGHFGYNFWIRTPKALKKQPYKNNKTMEMAIERVLKNKGFEVLEWVTKR